MIICINGFKNEGKDTVADYFVEQHGFIKLSLATKVKECLAAFFDVPVSLLEKYKNDPEAIVSLDISNAGEGTLHRSDMTLRHSMQRMGTEVGRKIIHENIWISLIASQMDWDSNYVIPDCRFKNEMLFFKPLGGKIIQVRRPGFDNSDGHSSEVRPDDALIDYVFCNDSDIPTLYSKLEAWYGTL